MIYTVAVDYSKCTGCSLCTIICPTGTLKLDTSNKKAYTTSNECDNAWGCITACNQNALEIVEAN
ncbi:MAG: 4Fe-4S binding protein [Candidatus Izimaplasma sp.]|nr:4Fe-4S binding protein [Candidatus Izimaplasma bacterium]